MENTMTQRILIVATVVLLFASIATSQEMNRLVDWQLVVPGSDAKALEIVGITVNQTNITTGRPFSAGEDWLDKLTFKVRNTSDKTITLFAFGVAFPEIELGGGRTAMLSIPYDAQKNPPKRQPLSPGSEVELTLPPDQLALLRQVSLKRIGTVHLTRVNILPGLVNFADGSKLGGISLRKT
jgi:hypothetical protein